MKINPTNFKTTALVIAVSATLAGCNSGGGDSAAAPANPNYSVMGEMEFNESVTHLDRYYDVKATFTNNSEAAITNPVVTSNSDLHIVTSTCEGDIGVGASCEVSGKFRPEQAGLDYDLTYNFESDQASAQVATKTTSAEPVMWYTTTPITNYSPNDVGLTSAITFYNNTDETMYRTLEWGVTNFGSQSDFKDNGQCSEVPAQGSCQQRIYFDVMVATNEADLNQYAEVIVTDQDGNSSKIDYKTTSSKMGIDYRATDNHSGEGNYDMNVATEAYYEMGKTYNGKFKMRIWDTNPDTNLVNRGSEILTTNGIAKVIFTGDSNECSVKAPLDQQKPEPTAAEQITGTATNDCYVNYEYTPDHVGPVTFSIVNQWSDTQAIADGVTTNKTSTWTEQTKNVVEVVDIDVIVDGTTNEVEAFTTEDIFKGKGHDSRFNLLEDKSLRNGAEFGNTMEIADNEHDYNWNSSDDHTGDYMNAKNGDYHGQFYARIDGQLYNLNDADPKSESVEVKREYVFNSEHLIGLDATQAEDSTVLFVAPWKDQPVTHKINLKFITDVQ